MESSAGLCSRSNPNWKRCPEPGIARHIGRSGGRLVTAQPLARTANQVTPAVFSHLPQFLRCRPSRVSAGSRGPVRKNDAARCHIYRTIHMPVLQGDSDAAMNPEIGFRQSAAEDRATDDKCLRWRENGGAFTIYGTRERQSPPPRRPASARVHQEKWERSCAS